MELDDKVKVTLTKEGADYLIERNEFSRRIATKFANLPIEEVNKLYPLNYHDRQVIKGTLREIITTFDIAFLTRTNTPFTNLQLDDKKCSCREGLRASQIS